MRMSLVVVVVAGVALAGCATVMRTSQQEQEELRAQVGTLQSQVAALSSQVEELRSRQQSVEDRAWDQGRPVAVQQGSAPRRIQTVLTAKEIQLALSRAGYYQGPIDGKIGPKTRVAIKAFQSANNLVTDGVAGGKTMAALQAYLTVEGQ